MHQYDLNNSLLYADGDLVLHEARVVVPALHRRTLIRLHDGHHGTDMTQRSRQTVFWPGINVDITSTVQACEPCQRNLLESEL